MPTNDNSGTSQGKDNVRRYFQTALKGQKLPSLPLVVVKVLNMVRDGDVGVHQLARVIADDQALTSRVMAISRSAYYAQRSKSTGLPHAIQLIGFMALRSIVVATSAQRLFMVNCPLSQKLWSHSVATAIAARMVAQRIGYGDREQAYLGGLLHDVGQMILLHGDTLGYERLAAQVEKSQTSWLVNEIAAYGLDHAEMGRSLLKAWDIGGGIEDAIFSHHEAVNLGRLATLSNVIHLADYLSVLAGLGVHAAPEVPSAEVLAALGWDKEAELKACVDAVAAEFEQESLLLGAAA